MISTQEGKGQNWAEQRRLEMEEVTGCSLKYSQGRAHWEGDIGQSPEGREKVGCTNIQEVLSKHTEDMANTRDDYANSCSGGRDRDRELQDACQNLNVNEAESNKLNMQRVSF